MNLIERVVKDLLEIVVNSFNFLEAFNKKGFLGTMMAGTKVSNKFAVFDKQLTTKLNDLTLGLGIHQHHVAVTTFQAMEDIESILYELGGMAAISLDIAKLNELAQRMGALSNAT
jgi:hypothetical protein